MSLFSDPPIHFVIGCMQGRDLLPEGRLMSLPPSSMSLSFQPFPCWLHQALTCPGLALPCYMHLLLLCYLSPFPSSHFQRVLIILTPPARRTFDLHQAMLNWYILVVWTTHLTALLPTTSPSSTVLSWQVQKAAHVLVMSLPSLFCHLS